MCFGDFGGGRGLALRRGMKRILGLSAAALVVILQLAGLAAWRTEPAIYLAPVDGHDRVHEHA